MDLVDLDVLSWDGDGCLGCIHILGDIHRFIFSLHQCTAETCKLMTVKTQMKLVAYCSLAETVSMNYPWLFLILIPLLVGLSLIPTCDRNRLARQLMGFLQ